MNENDYFDLCGTHCDYVAELSEADTKIGLGCYFKMLKNAGAETGSETIETLDGPATLRYFILTKEVKEKLPRDRYEALIKLMDDLTLEKFATDEHLS